MKLVHKILLFMIVAAIYLGYDKTDTFGNADTVASITQDNAEAIQNVANMFNAGEITIPKLKVNGTIEATGEITASRATFTGHISANSGKVSNKMEADKYQVNGGGNTFHIKNNPGYGGNNRSPLLHITTDGVDMSVYKAGQNTTMRLGGNHVRLF